MSGTVVLLSLCKKASKSRFYGGVVVVVVVALADQFEPGGLKLQRKQHVPKSRTHTLT